MTAIVPTRSVIRRVMLMVADHCGLTPEELMSDSKKRERVHARRISLMIIRRLYPMASNVTLGELYGKEKDWVSRSIHGLQDIMYTDTDVRRDVESLVTTVVNTIQENEKNERTHTDSGIPNHPHDSGQRTERS